MVARRHSLATLLAGSTLVLGACSVVPYALQSPAPVVAKVPGGTQSAGAGVTAIVVNETPGSSVGLDATLESLSRHVGGIPLVAIPRVGWEPAIGRLAGLLC